MTMGRRSSATIHNTMFNSVSAVALDSNDREGNVMKTRSKFAPILVLVFIGALVVNPSTLLAGRVMAQDKKPEPKLTTTTSADDKYGKGGTVETTSDDKLKVSYEVWRDKDGKVRETHDIEYEGRDTASETWRFSKDGKKIAFTLLKVRDIVIESRPLIYSGKWNLIVEDGSQKVLDYVDATTKEKIAKKVEEIEDQFIKDGKIPAEKEYPKETKDTREKLKQETPKSDETPKDDVEQPKLPSNKEVFGPDSKPKTSTPSTQPEAKPSPNPKSSSPPNPNTTTGAIDPCLVGSWRSESVRFLDSPISGGDGIALTIKADGTVIINYSEMSPIKSFAGESNTWSGSVTFHITTDKGRAIFKSAEKSEVTHTYTDPNGVSRSNDANRGAPFAALGVDRLDKTYQCERDTLTYKYVVETFTFKRQENPSN
jgi:hypothetical protein